MQSPLDLADNDRAPNGTVPVQSGGAARLTAVGHAGFILEAGDTVLLVDPWLVGTAFDDGWAQYTPPDLAPDLAERVTHIWFSHEHPDHFSPPSIRSINLPDRAKVTVLYQRITDQRVVEYCSKLGFATESLPPFEWSKISADVSVMCNPWRDGDSYLVMRVGDQVVLNLNDCVVRSSRDVVAVLDDIGLSPTVLMTQFSYANRVGNPPDVDARARAARAVLDRVATQANLLRSPYVIPFASYVFFCHEENGYMNGEANPVSSAVAHIASNTSATPVVLRPGDFWALGHPPAAPDAASNAYDADLARASAGQPLVRSEPPLSDERLDFLARMFLSDLASANGRVIFIAANWTRRWLPIAFWLTDSQQAVRLSHRGLEHLDLPSDACDLALSSSALGFFLEYRFGGSTLMVNGRFRTSGGSPRRFYRLVRVRDANNQGASTIRGELNRVGRAVERRLPPHSTLARRLRRRPQ